MLSIEALGYRWTLEHNTQLADLQRLDMDRDISSYITDQDLRPAEIAALYTMLDPYWPNIISTITKLEKITVTPENLEDPENSLKTVYTEDRTFMFDLLYKPQVWIDLVSTARSAGKDSDIIILHNAAVSLNPHWNPEPPKDTPETATAKKK
jgi:hypothetical protein